MAKDFARSFYRSKLWLTARRAFISKRRLIDGGYCEMCRDRLGYIVDHIEELTETNIQDASISLDPANFQYLCLPCHNYKTHNTAKVKFDADGNPVI